ncbi:MAG: DUF2784 domain-containing protein [Pseudomonadota bacterium]
MMIGMLSDITILFHFLWVLFIVFGIILVWRWPKIAFVHLGGLIFSLIINIFGWYCPLTYLENYLHALSVRGLGYKVSFVQHHLVPIVYPDLPERTIRIGEILFVFVLLIVYGALARRLYIRSHSSSG